MYSLTTTKKQKAAAKACQTDAMCYNIHKSARKIQSLQREFFYGAVKHFFYDFYLFFANFMQIFNSIFL